MRLETFAAIARVTSDHALMNASRNNRKTRASIFAAVRHRHRYLIHERSCSDIPCARMPARDSRTAPPLSDRILFLPECPAPLLQFREREITSTWRKRGAWSL